MKFSLGVALGVAAACLVLRKTKPTYPLLAAVADKTPKNRMASTINPSMYKLCDTDDLLDSIDNREFATALRNQMHREYERRKKP